MPRSLEDRRRAVVQALRALATEPRGRVATRPSIPVAPAVAATEPVLDALVDAVDSRLDALNAKISEVLARLDSVETTLLEAAWERPAASDAVADVEPEPDADERVSVPQVPLGEGRMSQVAADALFGG